MSADTVKALTQRLAAETVANLERYGWGLEDSRLEQLSRDLGVDEAVVREEVPSVGVDANHGSGQRMPESRQRRIQQGIEEEEGREAEQRGEDLGLSHQEHAFLDALETNEAAVRELGEDVLCEIAKAMTQALKENVTVDWAVSERKQARLRIILRDLLDKFGYPPDHQEAAVRTVLEQAKLSASQNSNGGSV